MLPSGTFSVAFPKNHWYPACRSRDLGRRPVAVRLLDTPVVLFRTAGGAPAALLDRCAHRNYPLSLGRVDGDAVECGYHGWRFDGCGDCVGIPGLVPEGAPPPSPARRVPRYATAEQDGFVWIWPAAGEAPPAGRSPFRLAALGTGPGEGEVVLEEDLDCTMHASLENALDVPHTAFVHGGLFRGRDRHTVTVVRRQLAEGVEAQYIGEPAGMGPIRLPEGSSRTFDHWDRFFLPSIAEIEYAVDGWFRIVNTILHLPLSPFRTRAWFVVRWWSRLPSALVRPIVMARGRQILRQDVAALARQTERIRDLGGERYASSELDVLGTAIWHLLRQAEKGDEAADDDRDGAGSERTVTFEI